MAGVGTRIENKTMAQPILMTEDYWANSQFSVVRYTGSMKWNGVVYVICNKEGRILGVSTIGTTQSFFDQEFRYAKHEAGQ